jgi:hypothetical protein
LHVDDQVSFEAQLLLPIKTLAYSVPPHTFMDYFQMSKVMQDTAPVSLMLQSRKSTPRNTCDYKLLKMSSRL